MKNTCFFYVGFFVVVGGICCAADQFDPVYIDNSTLGITDTDTQTNATPQPVSMPSASQNNVSEAPQADASTMVAPAVEPEDNALPPETLPTDTTQTEEQVALDDTQPSVAATPTEPTDSIQKQDLSIDQNKVSSDDSSGASVSNQPVDSLKKNSHEIRGRVPVMKRQVIAKREQLQKRTSKIKKLQQISDQRLQNKLHERSMDKRVANKMTDKKVQEQRSVDLRRGVKKKREGQGKGGPVRKRRIKRFDVPTDEKARPRVATQN